MDILDVSDSQKYVALLGGQKAALGAAKARQGQCPHDRRSSSELVQAHMMHHRREQSMTLYTDMTGVMRSSFVSPSYEPSVEPLEKLNQVFIKDLLLETHHRGSYLVLRSMTPPNTMTAVTFVVEDEKEDATLIQLYQLDNLTDWPSASVTKEDDVMIIKEPYFKVMADGNYGLRVDHVSDIAKLEQEDPQFPLRWSSRVSDLDKSADDWRLEGNDEFKGRNYWKAIQNYTAALDCPVSLAQKDTIRLNLSLAHHKLGYFEAALDDTDCLRGLPDASEKALYRAALALYALERFEECSEILTQLCSRFPNNSDAVIQLKRLTKRLEERASGRYNFKDIHQQAQTLRPPHFDHATYLGPVIIKDSEGRGRGMFTTKAVKAGDLVLCEKAFAHCYAKSDGESVADDPGTGVLINLQTDRITVGSQNNLITRIVQKLRRNPSFLPEFTALHHGTYTPVSSLEVDSKPIIDTFLVERIISFNAFGCPLSSLQSHIKSSEKKEQHQSCGVWLKASCINHSCRSNVRRSFIGDLMLVRTTCDIPAETELRFWYQKPSAKSFQEIQSGLKTWAFECDCIICTDAKSSPIKFIKKRKLLLNDLLVAAQNSDRLDLPKANRIAAAIEATYKSPADKIPRLALWEPYILIARAYAAANEPSRVVSSALKFLRSLSFIVKGADPPFGPSRSLEVVQWGLMIDSVVEAWTHLWTAYAVVAAQLCSRAEEYAKTSYRMCVGWDELFEDYYGKPARDAIQSSQRQITPSD